MLTAMLIASIARVVYRYKISRNSKKLADGHLGRDAGSDQGL